MTKDVLFEQEPIVENFSTHIAFAFDRFFVVPCDVVLVRNRVLAQFSTGFALNWFLFVRPQMLCHAKLMDELTTLIARYFSLPRMLCHMNPQTLAIVEYLSTRVTFTFMLSLTVHRIFVRILNPRSFKLFATHVTAESLLSLSRFFLVNRILVGIPDSGCFKGFSTNVTAE